jgi:hypothetical protein
VRRRREQFSETCRQIYRLAAEVAIARPQAD